VLPDGSYEAIVVDADGDGVADVMVLSITVLTGEHKGHVVDVQAVQLQYDPIDLLAMPCVLVVQGGEPKVIFD
jgi:hypothetical protein